MNIRKHTSAAEALVIKAARTYALAVAGFTIDGCGVARRSTVTDAHEQYTQNRAELLLELAKQLPDAAVMDDMEAAQ